MAEKKTYEITYKIICTATAVVEAESEEEARRLVAEGKGTYVLVGQDGPAHSAADEA